MGNWKKFFKNEIIKPGIVLSNDLYIYRLESLYKFCKA